MRKDTDSIKSDTDLIKSSGQQHCRKESNVRYILMKIKCMLMIIWYRFSGEKYYKLVLI